MEILIQFFLNFRIVFIIFLVFFFYFISFIKIFVLTEEQLYDVEQEANEAVLRNVPVTISYPSKEELETMDYRSKKEIEGQVRIVTIEGYDSCACCGTHVAKTGEIRLIKILSAQKYKGGVRVTMLSGEKAYADYCLKHINTLGIAWRSMPGGLENIIKYCQEANISSIELMGGDLEAYLGAPENPMMKFFISGSVTASIICPTALIKPITVRTPRTILPCGIRFGIPDSFDG